MASEGERASDSSEFDELSTVELIRKIAAKNARADLDSEEQMKLFLQSWWSRQYNRPLKDPLLQEYTLEELLYEFYDKIERRAAEEEQRDKEEIKQEEAKDKAAMDWAEKMEKEELAKMKEEAAKNQDPTKDPENIKWMEEQLQAAKKQHGESFGEDLELNFNE